jgi:hypothetical protein
MFTTGWASALTFSTVNRLRPNTARAICAVPNDDAGADQDDDQDRHQPEDGFLPGIVFADLGQLVLMGAARARIRYGKTDAERHVIDGAGRLRSRRMVRHVAKRSGTTQAEARAKLGLKVQRTVRRDRWFIDLSPQPRKSS